MKIEDFIVFFPTAFMSFTTKFIKTNISEVSKEYIHENHLYHCVQNRETVDKIMKSGYLKPSANIISYGRKASFMFAGMPTVDSFMKNLSINYYANPQEIVNAVEIDIRKEELNKNYKIRPLNDESIMYEGYCILPMERTKKVQLVLDLKRDENGNPIINNNTNEPIGVEFRKRTEDEIAENPDKYIGRKDFLAYMEKKQKEEGILKGEGKIAKVFNEANFTISGVRAEYKEILKNTRKNFVPTIKGIIEGLKIPKRLDESAESKIDRIVHSKSFLERKNPYREKKFSSHVIKFYGEGLEQYQLADVLEDFNASKEAMFLRDKYDNIDKGAIGKSSLHGLKHTSRVAILSMMIARKEGFINENSEREMEILTLASFYHDIGKVLEMGPHAKRGARLAKKMDLKDLKGNTIDEKDSAIIRMLIEGHEGRDDKVEKLMDKYKIGKEDRERAKNLLAALKDADALDRSRLTLNTPLFTLTDLDPKYLRLDTSKRLMEFSYGLEYLTHEVKNHEDILNYKNPNRGKHFHDPREEFLRGKLVDENTKENLRDVSLNFENVNDRVADNEETQK